jgi:DNA-directed RNA polymerase subunit beta'
MIENQTKEARSLLLEEMEERPILINRAPSWHKFNVLAFRGRVVPEDVIRVSPLIVSGFNMDFDGDTATMHVPVSPKAATEAWKKMRPSRNLFAVTDRSSLQHVPSKEMVMGLYHLTKPPTKKTPQVFKTLADAKRAYHQGLIAINDPIEILESN